MTVDTMTEDRASIIFSVDVEDWGQSVLDRSLPLSDYCADNARRLLELLRQDPSAKGTFFVLGKFAEKHPVVVRELRAAGHEVACHGYGHVQLHRLDRTAFREDLRRACGIISDITGEALTGYRAPVFSIGPGTLWALDILSEEHIRFDSSIFPINGGRYGIGNWPDEARVVRLNGDRTITEFPLTATRVAGRRWPIAGGGYARALPGSLLVRFFRSEAARRSTWPVFYCHPYEIDPQEFRRAKPPPTWGSRRLPLTLRLHQGLGRRCFADKLLRLMKHFHFRSFEDARLSMGALPEIRPADYGLDYPQHASFPANAPRTAKRSKMFMDPFPSHG